MREHPDADIDAPEAWDATTGNGATIVAVIDSGVEHTHPDLQDNMWVNPGEIPGNGVGDYAMVIGPDITDVSGNVMDQDLDGTGGVVPDDQYEATFAISDALVFESTDVPAPITWPYTTISYLTIDQDVTIDDLNVQLDITHPYDWDLQIDLVSPALTIVGLAHQRGGSGDNYQDTIFDDEAALHITEGTAPFAGSYRPETPLSAVDGETARGTWELWVTDWYVLDDGTLNAWSLTIQPPSTPQPNQPPLAVGDTYSTNEDNVLSVPAELGVLDNDTDSESDPLTAIEVGGVSHGILALDSDGSFTYTPAADFHGTDSFTYKANDGELDSNVATVTIEVAPIADISIAATDAIKPEGDSATTPFGFTVSLDEPAAGTVTVYWEVAGSGSHSADAADFGGALPSDTVTFAAGQISRPVTVDVSGDSAVEGDEGFTVTLSSPSAGASIAAGSASGTLVNDDEPPSSYDYRDVASAEASVLGTPAGTLEDTYADDEASESITEERYNRDRRTKLEHTWTFDVTGGNLGVSFHLLAGHDSTVETFHFEYDAQDGAGWQPLVTLSQTAERDYSVDLPTSLSGEVLVRVTDTDRGKEPVADSVTIDEMYFLSQRSGELPLRVAIRAADAAAAEEGADPGTFVIEVTGGGPLESDLTVCYDRGGTATPGSDYSETLPGSAVIEAGATSVTLWVTPADDDLKEGTETVGLTLIENAAYEIDVASQATVSIADNDVSLFVAQSETPVYGIVSGGYRDTHDSDDAWQTLTEERYTGGNKKSRLEHRWAFDLAGQTDLEFVLEAVHDTPGDPDDFLFQLSTDGGATWSDLLTVTPGSDPVQTTPVALPGGTTEALVRVIDTDNSNDRSSARLRIDQMLFQPLGGGSSVGQSAAGLDGQWLAAAHWVLSRRTGRSGTHGAPFTIVPSAVGLTD